jgi:glycosyltransferase involved in cell wall biosynthesis
MLPTFVVGIFMMLQTWFGGHVTNGEKSIGRLPNMPAVPVRAIVAIPARDEEDRIETCLEALLDQKDREGRPLPPDSFGIVLLLNNCRDQTAEIARKHLASSPRPSVLVQTTFDSSQANAGWARRVALDFGALWIELARRPNGVLLTTDADSRVPPQWIARNLSAIDAGCAAVAGRVTLDASEERLLPQSLLQRAAQEHAYEQALIALRASIDPIPHDPWPNHWAASGASYAITLAAYRAIGGLPYPANGEDRALTAALLRYDVPIRHDPDIVVVTSARLEGRAVGGAADAMRIRCNDPGAPGDEKLEALPAAVRRYFWRSRLRRWHAAGILPQKAWRNFLGLPADWRPDADATTFGSLWAEVEAASPLLVAAPLMPWQLPMHTAAAKAALAIIEPPGITRRQDCPNGRLRCAHAGTGERIALAPA